MPVDITKQIVTDPILKEMVAYILQAGNPRKIVLFGSRATGQARKGSDYDLLLIESSALPRYKRSARYRRALAGVGSPKDILVWTPEEVAEWSGVPNAFITNILDTGMVLYER